jgi:hypothetical protein
VYYRGTSYYYTTNIFTSSYKRKSQATLFCVDVAAGSPQRHKAWPKKQKGKNREERRGAEKM